MQQELNKTMLRITFGVNVVVFFDIFIQRDQRAFSCGNESLHIEKRD